MFESFGAAEVGQDAQAAPDHPRRADPPGEGKLFLRQPPRFLVLAQCRQRSGAQ